MRSHARGYALPCLKQLIFLLIVIIPLGCKKKESTAVWPSVEGKNRRLTALVFQRPDGSVDSFSYTSSEGAGIKIGTVGDNDGDPVNFIVTSGGEKINTVQIEYKYGTLKEMTLIRNRVYDSLKSRLADGLRYSFEKWDEREISSEDWYGNNYIDRYYFQDSSSRVYIDYKGSKTAYWEYVRGTAKAKVPDGANGRLQWVREAILGCSDADYQDAASLLTFIDVKDLIIERQLYRNDTLVTTGVHNYKYGYVIDNEGYITEKTITDNTGNSYRIWYRYVRY